MSRPDGESKHLRCGACSERIHKVQGQWTHVHSGDMYCGTGDGSTAYPPLSGDTDE